MGVNMKLQQGVVETENIIDKDKNKQKQEEKFLEIYNKTGSQKEAASAVDWDKSRASRFIKKVRETEPERLKAIKEESKTIEQGTPQTPQKPQIAPKQSQPNKSIPKEEKSENGANTKRKKQVFSFRAAIEDIAIWKAYATATGQTMEQIGTAAMNEYLANHALAGTEQVIFEAMKTKNENK